MIPSMTRGPIFAIFLSVAACADFPDLDNTVSAGARAADFPTLAPIDSLIGNQPPPRLTETDVEALSDRIARLRARASALRRPVIDRITRARLQRALAG
jgi:hypothetical protein